MKTFLIFAVLLLSTPFVLWAYDVIPGQFIVRLSPDSAPGVMAKDYGVRPKYVYRYAMNGFAALLSEEVRGELLKDIRTIAIEPDKMVKHTSVGFADTWGLDRIDQRALPLNGRYTYSSEGSKVVVFVIDSGIYYGHEEFEGRASFGYDAFGGDGADCSGHGTHVAATIGGAKYGVAKNVMLKSVRALNCNGSGSTSGVIAGIDWIISQKISPAVANLSLGSSSASQALDAAVKKMIWSGVATSIAAGNSRKDACVTSPARVADAMTVGASDANDAKASFSNYGACIDWFAPGVSIESAGISSPAAIKSMSGTSMAAPHTAGVAALYLEGHPEATPMEVRDRLLSFTTKGAISGTETKNNHLLYSFNEVSGDGDFVSPDSAIITYPTDGARARRGRAIIIKAEASDDVGIHSMNFYVNGSLQCTDTTKPFACKWRVPLFTRSAQVIEVIALDAAGNRKSSRPIVVRP